MKDEIKEILEDYKKLAGEITEKLDNTAEYESWLIVQDYFDKLLDYITNLQEENERLKVDKKTIQRWYNLCKSKNEKASKIIQDIFKDENWYKNYEYNDLEDTLKNVDDILNGGDDNG